ADPGITDRDLDQPVLWHSPNVDPPALRREFDRIRQQVQDDLPDLPLIGLNLAQSAIDVHLQSDAPASGTLADQGQGAVECSREVEVGQLQLHPPGLDL